MRRHRGRVGLMAMTLVGVLVSGASADIVTERSASVLVFPKVVANGTRDTLIQITNTSNTMVHAHCFYVNAAPTFPELPPDPINNPPLWIEIDFDIWLTKQQPTYWVVSTGRQDNDALPTAERACDFTEDKYDCANAGFDPGAVPPVVEDFVGELKCIETDQVGAPISGNHLKGEATIITANVCDPATSTCTVDGQSCSVTCSPDWDSAKYNAVGIIGNEFNNGDATLCLGGEPNEDCPEGAEYNGCPENWILNHFAEGAEDPVLGEGSSVRTSVTIVPCTQNFETQAPELYAIQNLTYDEFENVFSSSLQYRCWEDTYLEDIDNLFVNGDDGGALFTTFAQTLMRPTNGSQSGFMMVATEAHTTTAGRTATAAFNVHHRGTRGGQDLITIPGEQIQ